MYDNFDLKVGDTVQVGAGYGPLMVVEDVEVQEDTEEVRVSTFWFDDKQHLCRDVFPLPCLVKITFQNLRRSEGSDTYED